MYYSLSPDMHRFDLRCCHLLRRQITGIHGSRHGVVCPAGGREEHCPGNRADTVGGRSYGIFEEEALSLINLGLLWQMNMEDIQR